MSDDFHDSGWSEFISCCLYSTHKEQVISRTKWRSSIMYYYYSDRGKFGSFITKASSESCDLQNTDKVFVAIKDNDEMLENER